MIGTSRKSFLAGLGAHDRLAATIATNVLAAMRAPFERLSIGVDAWVVDIDSPGARVIA